MQLENITLHDFRTYAGRQTIDLSPTGKNKPIILIGGLNGAGKTTLLDALQLVLYGGRANLASRGNQSYKNYLREAIHRNSDPGAGAAIELTFRHASEGAERSYRVRRTWYPTGSGVSEHVEVEVDGQPDEVLTQHWDERVDDFVPHRISNLFFFDGEKLEALKERETSAEILRTAIHSLLGLDLVDRLVSDLAILDRKKRKDDAPDIDRSGSAAAETELNRVKGELEAAVDQRAQLLTRLDREARVKQKAQRAYKEEGGELADSRVSLEAELGRLQRDREEARVKLRELALGSLPLLMVESRVRALQTDAKSEADARSAAAALGILQQRDNWLLGLLSTAGVEQELHDDITARLTQDREQRSEAAQSGSSLIDESLAGALDKVAGELPAMRSRGEELRTQIDQLTESILLVERQLAGIPEEGHLADLRDAKAAAEAEHGATSGELAVTDERIGRLENQVESATEKLRRELERELGMLKEGDSGRRLLERAQEATATLEAFRERILEDNIHRVEVAVLESFQHLVRKPGLVNRLTIDPETFEVGLTNDRGRQVKQDDLSAGESQLLAIALLWGLAKTAGLPMPVVIDTPLGRLDSVHRTKLINNYFPCASHQVLLLSTDEEIRSQRLSELEPRTSRSYLLAYDDDLDRTNITEGYFEHAQ